MIRLSLSYVLAFAAALAAAWAVAALGRLLPPPAFSPVQVIGRAGLQLATGVTCFTLVFGQAMQFRPGPRFWLVALGFTMLALMLFLGPAYLGFVTPLESLVFAGLCLFIAGWVAVLPVRRK